MGLMSSQSYRVNEKRVRYDEVLKLEVFVNVMPEQTFGLV